MEERLPKITMYSSFMASQLLFDNCIVFVWPFTIYDHPLHTLNNQGLWSRLTYLEAPWKFPHKFHTTKTHPTPIANWFLSRNENTNTQNKPLVTGLCCYSWPKNSKTKKCCLVPFPPIHSQPSGGSLGFPQNEPPESPEVFWFVSKR